MNPLKIQYGHEIAYVWFCWMISTFLMGGEKIYTHYLSKTHYLQVKSHLSTAALLQRGWALPKPVSYTLACFPSHQQC